MIQKHVCNHGVIAFSAINPLCGCWPGRNACGPCFCRSCPPCPPAPPEPELVLRLLKLNASSGAPVAGAVFQLTQNGALIGEAVSQVSGEITFAGLRPGRYQLRETAPAPNYRPNTTLYQVEVLADGRIAVDGEFHGVFVIRNAPLQPMVLTGDAVNILQTSASIFNNTYSDIAGAISSVGIQYSTSPSLSAAQTAFGVIGSPFNANLTGLQSNTAYYYRAFVNATAGTRYGEIKSFTTPAGPIT